jgi:hypothetical protein
MIAKIVGMNAMYDQATGDLWIAWSGENFPTESTHFDSSIDAEIWCEKKGLKFHCLGIDEVVPGFEKSVSNKMRRILKD